MGINERGLVAILAIVVVLSSPSTHGLPVSSDGCADGTREGLEDVETYRRVAACGAAWSVPGVVGNKVVTPSCGKDGYGCSVHDACARGWHICTSPSEVDDLSASGTCSGLSDLYLTSKSEAVSAECDVHGVEQILGCGGSGAKDIGAGSACQPASTGIMADSIAHPWAVRGSMYDLGRGLVKRTVSAGGAMCCLDVRPTVFTVKPRLGPSEGGTRITVTGVDLGVDAADVESVQVGPSACVDIKWISSTELLCTTSRFNDTRQDTTTNGDQGTETDTESASVGHEIVVTTKSGGVGVGLTSAEFTYQRPGAELVAALSGGLSIEGLRPIVVNPEVSNYVYIRGRGWNGTNVEDIFVTVATLECSELAVTTEGYIKCLVPPLSGLPANASRVAIVSVDGKGSATSADSLRFLAKGEKTCESECSFTSECDLSVGQCVCRTGWVGPNCDEPAIRHGKPSAEFVDENGATLTFDVSLATRPETDVLIQYTSSNDQEARVVLGQLGFNRDNWDKPQTVTVLGVDDFVCDGAKAFAIVRTVASADRRFDGAPATTNDPLVFKNKPGRGKVVEIYPPTVGMTGDKVWIVAQSVCFEPIFFVDGVKYTPLTRSRQTRRATAKARQALATQSTQASRLLIRQSSNATIDDVESLPPITLPTGQEEFTIVLRNQTVAEGYRTLLMGEPGSTSLAASEALLVEQSAEDTVYFTAKCKRDGMFGTGAGCRDCPDGAICPGGTRAWPQDGFWTPSETSGIIRRCPRPESCLSNEEGIQTCAPGYTGDMCGACDSGYYELNQACQICPPTSDATYYVIADVILWTGLAVCGVFITHQMLFSYIVMLVKSLQSLAAIGAMGTERLPDWLQSVYSFLHLFSGDYSFVKPDCYNPTSVEEKFYSALVYNVIIFLPLLFGVPLTGLIYNTYNRFFTDKVETVIQASKDWYKDRTVRCFVIFLSTIYLPATTRAVAMLACQNSGDGVMYMIIEPSHVCYQTDQYWTALGVACIVLLMLTLVFPLAMMRYLLNNRDRMYEDRFGERFNFLYEFYKPGFTLFWAIEFAISCVIANASSTLVPHPKYQLSICTVVFGTKLLFILWKGPFLDWITNSIQVLLTIALVVAVNANYLLSLDLTRKVTVLRQTLPLAIVLIAGGTILGLLAIIVHYSWKAINETDEDDVSEDELDDIKKDDMLDFGFAVPTEESESEGEVDLGVAESSVFATMASLLPVSEHSDLRRRVSSFFASVVDSTIGGDDASGAGSDAEVEEMTAAAEEVILQVGDEEGEDVYPEDPDADGNAIDDIVGLSDELQDINGDLHDDYGSYADLRMSVEQPPALLDLPSEFYDESGSEAEY